MKPLPALLLVALAPSLWAQTPLHILKGDTADRFGDAVEVVGDVNADGHADVIVGSPKWFGKKGQATVYSGADFSIVHQLEGTGFGDHFGFDVAGVGDINQDGYDDFGVGSPFFDGGASHSFGRAQVFSGLDASVLFTFVGIGDGFDPVGDRNLGSSIAGAGDVNNDGTLDVIVGASSAFSAQSGRAKVFSGADGTMLRQYEDPGNTFFLGNTVDGLGDLNGDGHSEVVVGGAGLGLIDANARVYSGIDGTLMYLLGTDQKQLGSVVANAGDVNADGINDIVVGGFFVTTTDTADGMARIYSGADGSQVHEFLGAGEDARFGFSVDGIGDINGDGHDDVIVGAPNGTTDPFNPVGPMSIRPGSARVFSGKTGMALYAEEGTDDYDWFGDAVAGGGDINGDGWPDFVVGRPLDESQIPASEFPTAVVFTGCQLDLADVGEPGTSSARISVCGASLGGGNEGAIFRLTDGPANQFGFLYASENAVNVMAFGGTLVPATTDIAILFKTDALGKYTVPGLKVSNKPGQPAYTGNPIKLFAQVAHFDPSLTAGVGLTSALVVWVPLSPQ